MAARGDVSVSPIGNSQRERLIRFLTALKDHVAFRVATSYFIAAWLLIQAGDILLENFGAPGWIFRAMVVVLVVGFPIALAIAWVLESGKNRPGRIQDTTRTKGTGLAFALRIGAVVGMATLLIWLGWDKIRSGVSLAEPERPPSIAVLPFSDMSADGDQEFFAHGLSEEILNLLAGIRELKVSGRTSSFSFKDRDASIPEIGDALGVAHVLEGSVRKSGKKVRVTAQLVASEDGFHLWSKNYDRELSDIFAIQDEIAGAIASELRLSLVDAEGEAVNPNSTSSIEAYEHFLEARQLVQGRSVEGLRRALELLDRALELDPGFAPALAQSALAWLMLSDARITPGSAPLASAISSARPLLDRALDLNPRLASAHAVQGLLNILQRDFDQAEKSLAHALDINPSHSDALNWRAINLRNAGRLRDELNARQQLAEIDPLHLSNLFNLAMAYLLRGQPELALDTARRVQRDFPGSPWGDLAEVEALGGSGELARAELLAREHLADGNSMLVSAASSLNMTLGEFDQAMKVTDSEFGTALVAMGHVEEALDIARDFAASAPDDSTSALSLLRVLSLAGRHEEVLKYYEVRWGGLKALQRYFEFGSMTAELAPIAAAQSILSRNIALEATLDHWRQRLEAPREHGYGMPYFRFLESGFEALSGNHDKALSQLGEAIEGGYLNPLLHCEPVFHMLRDEPTFRGLVERNFRLINGEREKLDLAPMASTIACPVSGSR